MTCPDRPILRYHGGKWMLAPWIIEHLPPHRVYVEPYGGGASVLLQKTRSYAEVYNDLDGEIVELFRVLRQRPRDLVRLMAWTPFSRDEYRRSFEVSPDPLEQARRTMIRSFMGFGSDSIFRRIKSGFRSNSYRSHTTPSGDWRNLPRAAVQVAKRLRGVTIENRPALEVIEQQDRPDTLFYLDPPYVHSTRVDVGPHNGYRHEMTDDDHRALADKLRGISGMAVLSGYRSELYEDLYGDWETTERVALADHGSERLEVLWLNPNAWDRLHSGLFAPGRKS